MEADLSYILNHLGEEREKYYRAVSPPIFQTSNFCFPTVEEFRAHLQDETQGHIYSRGKNPTSDILCAKLAALDGQEEAIVFGSGIASIVTPIIALLQSGDHIVSVRNVYSWTTKLFTQLLPRYGVTCTFVDGRDTAEFEKAIRPETKLIYLESPNTFTFELQDIEAVGKLARSRGITTLIDNSWAGPLLQQPAKYGIDLVAQSASKYLGGHSDIVGGVLTGPHRLMKKIFTEEYLNLGPAMSPYNAWLLLRGLRTLPLRMEHSSKSVMKVAEFLAQHPKVERVIHPHHPSHPQHDLAKRLISAPGGLFAFVLKEAGIEQIENFCNSLKRFLMAVSWGGHESLIIPVCATIKKEEFNPSEEKHRYIRMYVGLEETEVLIEDLSAALERL